VPWTMRPWTRYPPRSPRTTLISRAARLHECVRRHHAVVWQGLVIGRYIIYFHGTWELSCPYHPTPYRFLAVLYSAGIHMAHVIMCVSVSTLLRILYALVFCSIIICSSNISICMRSCRSCPPSNANMIRLVFLGILIKCMQSTSETYAKT
jgi:hypothetical protein